MINKSTNGPFNNVGFSISLVSAAIHQYFPQFLISDNVVPSSYVLFRAKENKYFDQSSNKYVIYPSIGSFEVTLDGEIIFSKKQTNSWPVIEDIVNEISMRVEGRPI